VLIFQYKTRKTLISQLILAATPLLAVIILFLTPTNAIIAHSYPPLTGDKTPTLSGLSDRMPPPAPPTGPLQNFRNYVTISLPVAVAGIDKDVNFLVRGTRATITTPGVSYTSPFLSFSPFTRPMQLNAGRPVAMLSFLLPQDVFEKVHNTPADVHVEFASEQLKAEKPSTWHATLLPFFSVPGNGICTFPAENDQVQLPTCRYPLQQPDISFVSAKLAPASCSNPPAVTGQASLGGRGATLDFDPVITVPINFQTGDPDPQHNYVLCPGSELHFVEATTLPDASLVLDQKQVTLDPFAARFTDRNPRTARPQPQQ